jgi:hypothetical protein
MGHCSPHSICAECLFADPIADVAVLGSPDIMDLSDQADAYEAIVESATPLQIADAPEQAHGWMLSLENKWFGSTIRYMRRLDGPLLVSDAAQPVVFGMSGEPIISDEGAAIGIVCLAAIRQAVRTPGLSEIFQAGLRVHRGRHESQNQWSVDHRQ